VSLLQRPNCPHLVRTAHAQINYRHFEDDMNPRVFKPEGLKHLDRVIDLVGSEKCPGGRPADVQCAKHGIYTVIDLHAAPGGQNLDWHADAGNNQANCERPGITSADLG